jgi:23S rRNA pseudouridine2605 synthase
LIRLQKYLAMCGVASRRKSEELITEGKVTVNGRVVKEQGVKVDPSNDHVKVDGKQVKMEGAKVYVLLNKPSAIVSSSKDQFGRKTVVDILGTRVKERVYPVGRLDYESEGLILLTNDGDLANRIIHPKYHMKKRYQVIVRGLMAEEEVSKLRTGVEIDSGTVKADNVRVMKVKENKTELEVTIHEGKNRQIRKMLEALDYEVIYLKRISIGPISDTELKRGEWRHLTNTEVRTLKELTNK